MRISPTCWHVTFDEISLRPALLKGPDIILDSSPFPKAQGAFVRARAPYSTNAIYPATQDAGSSYRTMCLPHIAERRLVLRQVRRTKEVLPVVSPRDSRLVSKRHVVYPTLQLRSGGMSDSEDPRKVFKDIGWTKLVKYPRCLQKHP